MPLTRLDNLISSKTGKYLYVSPDDFNATDALSNRGNSPVTPFKSIQRAFLEIARYSYLPGFGNDRFDQFSIMLMPGIHYIDNRPGLGDTANIAEFGFDPANNAWTDNSILDISNPDNVLYKFNNTEGGAIIPRGSSLVGYDLRRTVVRPLYVPDPAVTEREIPRSAIFNVTGGCYFWQFTIKDGQTTSESPLYNSSEGTGKVYYDPTDFTKLAAPNYSHHKLTVFEYADTEELSLFYRKISKAFKQYQPSIDLPGEFDFRVQENRIVGPLSDSRVIESLKVTDNSAGNNPQIPASTSEIEVTTKVDHGYFQGQFVAIANTEIDDVLEGIFPIKAIDQNDARKFTYEVPFVATAIGTNIQSGKILNAGSSPALGQNAQTLAEVDSVESASPYVFNVSIRSTWGICGIWANGLKATGFKSMVIAQYTGVSLQKDDRAFIRYDEYSNTWNQASLTDAFATVPYHTKGDSYWKDEWRNFHVRASEDAFIQNVSIFAVGFADHFLMESGGDMSITNSNSNFGNTSLHAIGFKGFAFNQDKGGYIDAIIPPKQVVDTVANTERINYYTIDVQGTRAGNNTTKLFLGSDELKNPLERPAATITGFRIGAKSNEKLYFKGAASSVGDTYNVELEPTGFVKYVAKGSLLTPTGFAANNNYADAANLIESNRRMIQEEVFGYILEKYPRLQSIPYVNPGLNPAGNRYFDGRNLILANRQWIIDESFADTTRTFGTTFINAITNGEEKCKRDIGLIVDAIAEDLRDGGNSNIIAATRTYFDGAGSPLTNGLAGEEQYSVYAFNRARDYCKKAIANLLPIKADLYDPDSNSIYFNGNTPKYPDFVQGKGKTGSQAELDGDTTNGVTIDLAIKQDPAGRNKDARNRIEANKEFILDAALAEVSVYHPDFYIPGDTQTNAQSRLADAFRMIRRNSSEIRDKALASIALNHPNFYIDGDQQTDEGSRYASAYRLILNNRAQIVDTALAEITVGHPDFYIPGDQQTDERSRYADGYRLIQQNKSDIVDVAWTNMIATYPAVASTELKCKRDIGIFVDAVSLDLFVGGNKYARKFAQEYFDVNGNPLVNGLVGEEAESILAFNNAKDQMKLAVANQLAITDLTVTEGPATYGGSGGNVSRTNSGACADVQSAIETLTNIITTPINDGNLNSLPAETPYIAGPGEDKCRRDIGIFVDSLALDLFCKGNVYTYRFAAEYFENATTPITNGVVGEEAPTVTALNKAVEMIKKALTNQLYEKDLFRTADNAPGSVYGQVSKDFTPHGAIYDPATGSLLLDIANHGLSIGDRVKIADNGLTFTCTQDNNQTNHTYPRTTDPASGQYLEITAAATDTITVNVGASPAGQQYPHTFVSALAGCVNFAGNTANQNNAQNALCSDVQAAADTLGGIATTIITAGNLNSMPIEVNYGTGRGPGEIKCARDLGYFIDAVSVDMFIAGNRHIRSFTEQYFTNATTPLSNGLVGEEAESVTAFNTAIAEMKKAITNQLYYKDLTVTAGEATYGGGGGTIANTNTGACADVQATLQTLGEIATDAITNGNIQGGIWSTPVNEGAFLAGEAKCRRDLKIVIEAIAQDLWFGGNEYTVSVTKEYFYQNQLISNGVDNEVDPSITAFKRAEELMQRAANNVYYDRDLDITLDQTGDPPIVGNIECDAHDMVIENIDFIAAEAYERMLAAYPSYTPSTGNTAQDCRDDVVSVLKEVMWDVKFGGNYKTYDAAKIYVDNYDYRTGTAVSTFLDPERDEARKVFLEAKNIAMQVIKNETVSVSAGNSLTQVIDTTIVEDWDATELLPKCGSAVAAVDTLMGIIIQAIGTDAGVGNLNGITRTVPGTTSDPAWNTSLNITATTATSITLDVGASPAGQQYAHQFVSAATGAVVSGGNYLHRFVSAAGNAVSILNGSPLTPINATYNAVSGDMVLYFATAHGVTTSDQLSIAANSLTFKCEMDNFTADKTYPRATDPIIGQNIAITAVTSTSITVNVGTSPLVEHNVTNAIYDPASGSLALTIGAHTLTTGTGVKLKNESLLFKCAMDDYTSVRAYPRAATTYQPTAYDGGNCSDVLATINSLTDILCDSLKAGNLDNLPAISNGLWDCANVRSSIENLFDILTDAITDGTLAGLPNLNKGDFTVNNEASKCFRDVSYIVDALVNDLRLGGNINSIQAGEAYYVGNSLEYIDGEKTETLDAWNYVGQMAIAAMRNWDVLVQNCTTTSGSAIVDVNDTNGIIIGMSVKEYGSGDYTNGVLNSNATPNYSTIPDGAYVKRIVSNTQIELGAKSSRFGEGVLVNALANSSTIDLYFELENGVWADTLPQKDLTVSPDTTVSPTNRECSGTANAIINLTGVITTIINTGVGTVTRQEQTLNTALLANRATIFTIDTGGAASNPHNFETGTPVRLVPRPRWDTITQTYVDVDKRLVRLPNGFETNKTYYVIAPGRTTRPENYANSSVFDQTATTKLMLATSKENAAAGIYIYASETESVDPDVEIDLYQFVLDEKYDLHNYKCSVSANVSGGIQTDTAHIFDIPVQNQKDPQIVFFRTIPGSSDRLPLVSTIDQQTTPYISIQSGADAGRIDPNIEFYVRYISPKVFRIYRTPSDAENNTNPITFAGGQSDQFNVFCNKRTSPIRFDPTFTNTSTSDGKWYINCVDESSLQTNIFNRIGLADYAGKTKTTDMWYTRLTDDRDKEDRTYKLRYVIPSYLTNVRDPINGFVVKTRTDDTRRLVPQKILLKPVAGNVYGARFTNPARTNEFIGWQTSDFPAGLDPAVEESYDPYKKPGITDPAFEYRAFAKFASGVQATIQSGRYIEDTLDPSIKYLELTVFDHAIDVVNFAGLKNEILTTVKITAPQGGDFVVDKTAITSNNEVQFTGNSSGNANIHAYYTVNGDHYLIIKNINSGILEYSQYTNTRFTQGNVFADMLEDQDSGKSLPLKTHIKKNFPEYYYKQNGANVYTITPGDRITDSAGIEYYVDSVEDTGVIEDTFYVFATETIQKRIPGQQDGVYYLTCLRGNISPFPTGAGVINNFKKFKFSQPVSRLYPLNYRNDPLWFKKSGTTTSEKAYYGTLIDPPATFSAADNYIHGLVTTNDYKNSVTKELAEDLTKQPAFTVNNYTLVAQEGNATSGSEDRRIPIAGDSTVVTDQRYYVELRRPSIARAGNHTFEYLGFGPGNYSTGLPARQEVVLTPEEDFYAQSKKQDGGIVFYTGINSQGDLYIGNRRINAITGEETFIDSATLDDDGEEDDTVGGLVTTFDTPVTFNKNITVIGGDGQLTNTFESPILLNVADNDLTENRSPLIISSIVSPVDPVTQTEQDEGLDRSAFLPFDAGDITIGKNRVNAAVFGFNPRGRGQKYQIQTHTVAGAASNLTPNQDTLISAGGTRIQSGQFVNYGGVLSKPGDILLKGLEVGKTGGLGWIYTNYYIQIIAGSNQAISTIQFIPGTGITYVKLTFVDAGTGLDITNANLGITSGAQIRLNNYYPDTRLNAVWDIVDYPGDAFQTTDNYLYFQINFVVGAATESWPTIVSNTPTGNDDPTIEFSGSGSQWKEFGIIGGEALRTDTESIGDYKLGINTIARAAHDACETAFVSNETDPRANLDVVGTAFISGRSVLNWLNETGTTKSVVPSDNAFLVGGNSALPNEKAVFRVSTSAVDGTGKIGINTTVAQMSSLATDIVMVGTTTFVGNSTINGSLQILVGQLDTTSTTVDLMNTPTTVRFAMAAQTLEVANATTNTGNNVINIANYSNNSSFSLGNVAAITEFNVHRGSQTADVNIATVGNADASYNATLNLGGAFANSASITNIKTRNIFLDGDVNVGSGLTAGSGVGKLYSLNTQFDLLSASGGPSVVKFAATAADLTMGAQGGTTTINNALTVKARSDFFGDMLLTGGLNAGGVEVDRGVFGTTPAAQAAGGLPSNFNIDLYRKVDISKTLDTGGFATLSATEEFIRLNAPVLAGQIAIGDYLLLDESAAFTGSPGGYTPDEDRSEIVRVIELTNLTNSGDAQGIRVKVTRGVDGTTAQTHPDNLPIFKLNKSADVSYLLTSITNVDTQLSTAEFGGSLLVGDFLRLNDGEYTKVTSIIASQTSIKSLKVNDGGNPAVLAFSVESTTGNTYIRGNTEVHADLTLVGSATTGDQMFTINNGESSPTTVFDVDSSDGDTRILGDLSVGAGFNKLTVDASNGNTVLNGGDFTIFDSAGTGQKLKLTNNTGDLTISGLYTSTATTGVNTFASDLRLNGGDLQVYSGSDKRFQVNNSGTIDLGGVDYMFGPTGARRWDYFNITSGDGGILQANINLFVNPNGDLYVKLPTNPRSGDMVRFIDLGGNLKYDLKLVIRAATGVAIQGDSTNIAASVTGVDLTNHNGGELIVTTPNAALGLVYAGALNNNGQSSGVPSSAQGWWLMEI
jgi:hypothetical protein